jgi:uncharacterized protein YggU (UPF0235/DUF167 family)
VRVVESPHGGAATAAALVALAKALDVPSRSIRLLRGRAARRKLVEMTVDVDEAASVAARIARLLEG